MGTLKKCGKCKKLLPPNYFHKNPDGKNGLRSTCKICCKKYRHNHYLKNKEKIIKQTTKWRKKNPKKYQKYLKKYKQSKKGKESDSKHKAKRKRELGFNKLIKDDWNCPVDWHHVNDNDVVPLPRYLHRMCLTGDRETHRKLTNKLIKILYGDEIKWQD